MRAKHKPSHPLKPVVVILSTLAASAGGLLTAFLSNDGDRGGRGADEAARGNWASSVAGFYVPAAAKRVQPLTEGWLFRTGDDLGWSRPETDESDWTPIEIDEAWESQGFAEYEGLAWYRCHFLMNPEAMGRPLFLRLGRIDDGDEVWMNGQRIGGTGGMVPGSRTAWASERVYAIPTGVIRAGADNVIAVRVFDERLSGGMVGGQPAIMEQDLPQPLVDLAGVWKLSASDEARFALPATADVDFAEVVVPGAWDDQGRADFDGHLWYRRHFSLAPQSRAELVLLLGVIDDEDEVYLNGRLIGQIRQGEAEEAVWRLPRAYPFSGDVLLPGEEANVLAVRVHDVRGHGGIISGPVGVMTAADHAVWTAEKARASRSWARAWDWLLGRG